MSLSGISDRNRKLLAFSAALLLMALLLLLVSLDDQFTAEPPPQVLMREVQMYSPPPPPPPPPVERSRSSAAAPSLSLAPVESPVTLETLSLDVGMDLGSLAGFGFGSTGIGDQEGMGWDTFDFSELDGHPMVVSAPLLEFPEQALARNVKRFQVLLHILIDENGNCFPIRILSTPFPELNREILDYASQVRFSPPTRQGVPVRAEYRWPLLLTSDR